MVEERTPAIREDGAFRLTRRDFLVGATALGAATALRGGSFATASGEVFPDPAVRASSGGSNRPNRFRTGETGRTPASSWTRSATTSGCWPWDADPTAADAEQFRGWPYRLGFDETDGRG